MEIDFSELFNGGDMLDELKHLARTGNISELKNYFSIHHGHDHCNGEASELLDDLIYDPQQYRQKNDLVQIIFAGGFDFGFYLNAVRKMREEKTEEKIFSMYALSPDSETQQAAAVILAEFIRYKIAKDNSYQISFSKIADHAPALTLVQADQQRKWRESVLVTQNALVDYIAKEGPDAPLNRGAGFLHFLRGETGNEIWTKKISDIKEGVKYSLQKGDIKDYKPVFG